MKAAIRAHRFTDTVNVVTSFLSWLDLRAHCLNKCAGIGISGTRLLVKTLGLARPTLLCFRWCGGWGLCGVEHLSLPVFWLQPAP